VGRPLTPMSGAGVARRHYRRGAYGYGAGVVGAGLGAAAAVGAATSPWGWGGSTNYYGGDPYYGAGAYGNSYGSYAGDTDAVAYCTQRFRSYDPATGSYLGYDGLRHGCP
jgi:BA14K-like protein